MHADDPMNNSVDDWISILEGVDQDTWTCSGIFLSVKPGIDWSRRVAEKIGA